MDINTLRSFAVVLVAVAFVVVCWWAFSPKRKRQFEEAAQLPFADEPADEQKTEQNETNEQKETEGDNLQSADHKRGQG
ncbi:cytochrome c oxidase cbb3-type subunit 4 [Alteromonadaceae bacterium Bs31]|nr:cytochrome c oxidase cbb3-type subunit 4 [Alteromonadaceae bacterium Bs31]